MNIKTALCLAVGVIVGECTLIDISAHANPQVENIYSTLETIPNTAVAKETVTKKSRRTRKLDEGKSIETFDSEQLDKTAYLPPSSGSVPLEGSATCVELNPKFSATVYRLTKSALERNPDYEKAAKAVDYYGSKVQRTVRFTKDAVNYVYPYRGFSMSMEGSRLVMDKNQRLTNLCIAELTKQRYWDEMHPKIMAKMMQTAMGLGMQKSEEADIAVQKGVKELTDLVGEETAQSTVSELSDWNDQLSIPEPVFQQSPWDVDTTERVYQNALKTSSDGDPLVRYVFQTVKKFDHGKLVNCVASAVEANLSAVTVLSGNPLISVASEGASTAFVMSTGGPEENKILKELYFGRRLEIRRKRISDETELALTNYEKGLLTHNCPQLAMSEVVLAQLVGLEKIARVLERDPVNDFALAAPIELAKEDTK